MSLRAKAFSAARWTSAGTVLKFALQFAQVAVLARLLDPADYGLMAMVMSVVGFATQCSDFGVNSAFVQRRDVGENERNSLFWFNVMFSAGVMLVLIAVSTVVAELFGDRRITLLLILTSPVLLISALGSQVRMMAEKRLMFRAVMAIEVFGCFVGLCVSIFLAIYGNGVYSILGGTIAVASTNSILFWIFISDNWKPGFRFRMSEISSYLRFGSALVANNLVSQLNLSVDLFLGGRILGAEQLGLYSVPRDITLRVQGIINPIVTRISFPLIAEVQTDIERVRKIYLKTVNLTASINAPIYIAAMLFSADIVRIMLGPGWTRSAEVLSILAFWGAIRAIGNPVGSLLYGMGRANLSLKWNLCVMVLIIPAVWLGSLWGPKGIAWMLTVVVSVLYVPSWYFLARPICRVGFLEYSNAALGPILVSIVAITPSYLICSRFASIELRLPSAALLSICLYFLLSVLLRLEWIGVVKRVLKPKSEKAKIT